MDIHMEINDIIYDIERIVNNTINDEDLLNLQELFDMINENDFHKIEKYLLFKIGATFNFYEDIKRAKKAFTHCIKIYNSKFAKSALKNIMLKL